ncbi:MAG: type II toxin-antitoxin system RelE/ParE family toxin [Deltaproteobacteria bacterium]|nr:type II toxin-antitoxin system RelE/ParE family toxin [Deltaproteobacteria bacterium]
MARYRVVLARSARRELEGLDARQADRVLRRIEALAAAPRPPGRRKLVGRNDLRRIRVGDYRVVYAVDDDRAVVDVNAGSRSRIPTPGSSGGRERERARRPGPQRTPEREDPGRGRKPRSRPTRRAVVASAAMRERIPTP